MLSGIIFLLTSSQVESIVQHLTDKGLVQVAVAAAV